MNIGIFGGTFNPLHNVHCHIIEKFLEQYAPAIVHIIPCSLSPFKSKELLIDDKHRLEMLTLVFRSPDIVIDDREIRRGGISYTIETIKELKGIYPDDTLYLIIGGDQAKRFSEWKDYSQIVHFAEILIAERYGFGGFELIKQLFPESNSIKSLSVEVSDLSSSMIRNRVQHNETIDAFVPKQIADYIQEHSLYKL